MLIAAGGVGLCGIPELLIDAVVESGVKDLTIVSNNCGVDGFGLGKLLGTKQIKKMMSSYVGENVEFMRQFLSGELELEFTPRARWPNRCAPPGTASRAFTPRPASAPCARAAITATRIRALGRNSDGLGSQSDGGARRERASGRHLCEPRYRIPTLVSNFIPEGMTVTLQSENGMRGMGPVAYEGDEDPDLINAGKRTITERPQTVYFDRATSFGMIRGGKIAMAILGAMEVFEKGDLANWMIPSKLVKGMGGAMDLVAGVGRVVVVMDHANKHGESKVLKECTLPLTGKAVVNRIITNLGVMDVVEGGLELVELADGLSEEDFRAATEATLVS